MNFLPRSLIGLSPAYQPQPELSHTGHQNAVVQAVYGTYDFADASAFTLQAHLSGGQDMPLQHTPSHPLMLRPSYMQHDVDFAGDGQPTSTVPPQTTLSMGPPGRPRKRKAATLHAVDWEPYKKRILDLHATQNLPLPKVRQMIEEEYGFKAELRQYRTRISQWGKDKNVKPQEMEAIVRKRQKRKLVETNKGQLVFEVRGTHVEPQKIERWMKRHDVPDSFLYAPSPSAPTPSAIGCYTVSDRGSPAVISVYSPAALILSPGDTYLPAQSPHAPSPASSVSSIMRPQDTSFAGQSPAPTHRSPPSPLQPEVASASSRYREDEEMHLRNQILEAEMSPMSSTLRISDVLYELGKVLIDQGRYKAAEHVARKLLDEHRSEGDDNAEALKALDLLGDVLHCQGLYTKAERLFRRTLQKMKKVHGLEHPDTLMSMSSLAGVLRSLCKYEEAEEMHRQALTLYQKVLGSEHPSTLRSMYNLAVAIYKQGRFKEAEVKHREELAKSVEVFGSKHPETLASMHSVANSLYSQGSFEEAEVMHREILGLYRKVLGYEHPDTLMSMGTLASVLKSLGRYKEAEGMFKNTLALQKKVLGAEHPDTLKISSILESVTEWEGTHADLT